MKQAKRYGLAGFPIVIVCLTRLPEKHVPPPEDHQVSPWCRIYRLPMFWHPSTADRCDRHRTMILCRSAHKPTHVPQHR